MNSYERKNRKKKLRSSFIIYIIYCPCSKGISKTFPIISEKVCDDFEGSLRVFCFSDTGMPIPKLYGGRGGLDPSSAKSLVERGRT